MRALIQTCYLGVVRQALRIIRIGALRDLLIWPLASRLIGTHYTEPFRLTAGFVLHAYLEDQLGRFALFYGTKERYFWEPSTMRLLEHLVRDAHEVIIAGSHIGLTALYARKAMNTPNSRVHTFEPIQHLYEVSEQNFALNKNLGTIVLTHAALGSTPGTVTMTQDRIRSRIIDTPSKNKSIVTETVPITTISAYCTTHAIQRLDLVLLDVEGYEHNALRGMEHILKTNPPTHIIYEISFPMKDNLETAHKIDSYLSQFGYTTYIIVEAHDIGLPQVTNAKEMIVKTSPEVYKQHKNDRYFNVFATLQSDFSIF